MQAAAVALRSLRCAFLCTAVRAHGCAGMSLRSEGHAPARPVCLSVWLARAPSLAHRIASRRASAHPHSASRHGCTAHELHRRTPSPAAHRPLIHRSSTMGDRLDQWPKAKKETKTDAETTNNFTRTMRYDEKEASNHNSGN